MTTSLGTLHARLIALIGGDYLVTEGDSLETLSKDYYWYSPLLRPQLDPKRAELVAKPGTVEELRAVISACFAAGVAVTPRGGDPAGRWHRQLRTVCADSWRGGD